MTNALLIGALCLIWGATWVVIKVGLQDAPPFYSAAFRFLLASIVLGALVAIRRLRIPRDPRLLLWIFLPGFFMYFGSYAAVYWAEQYIDAALASIIFATFPFFVAIGAHFWLEGERLSWLKIIGLVIGFSGIVVIFGGGLRMPGPEAWWAMVVMMASPLASAIASIMVKRYLTGENPTTVNFLQMIVGTVMLMAMAGSYENLAEFHWTANAVGAVTFLAFFGSAFTFVTYYHLLRTIEATKMSLIAFVTPVVAAVLGWMILGERPTTAAIVGALLVFAGIYVVNILGRKKVGRLSDA